MGAEYKWREITYRGRRAAEITACPGDLPLLKVPETVVPQIPVVSLAKAALRGSETVQTVCLPETLVSLGDFAFYGCSALRKQNI